MDEVWFGVVLAFCVLAGAFLAYRIEKNANSLRHELALSVAKLDAKVFPELPDFDELRNSLEDLIEDTIGSMRTPQAADHLMAMAQQWFQIKMAKQMNDIPGLDLITGQEPRDPTQETSD
tara:strand:- start:826 stop:1185 length:360 start_codon:yes stop_codon:yes gene_type:complete